MARFTIDRIDINSGSHDFAITGLRDCQISEGMEYILEGGGSAVDPAFLAVHSVFPVLTGTTTDVVALLAAAWGDSAYVPHVPINAGSGKDGCDVYFQATSSGSTRGGAGTNLKYTISKGILVVNQISGAPVATATFTLYAEYNGTDAVIIRTDDTNLLAGTGAADALCRCQAIQDGTATLHQISDFSIDFGVTASFLEPLNSNYRTDSCITAFAPTASFTTTDVATALGTSGFSGHPADSNNLNFYLAQYTNDGLGVATGTAVKLSFHEGSVFTPTTIQLTHGQPISLAYNVTGIGGTTGTYADDAPLMYAADQDISSITETTTPSIKIAGPIAHNTTEIDYATATLTFGLNWVTDPQSARWLWPTHSCLMDRQPTLSIDCTDGDYYESLGTGSAISSGVHAYLRDVDDNSQPVADDTESHVKLSINAGRIIPQNIGGSHGQHFNPQVLVVGRKGDSDMLSIDTSAAISVS